MKPASAPFHPCGPRCKSAGLTPGLSGTRAVAQISTPAGRGVFEWPCAIERTAATEPSASAAVTPLNLKPLAETYLPEAISRRLL